MFSTLTLYGHHHQRALKESLQSFRERPLANLLTVLAIAIALTLPGALWDLLKTLSPTGQALETNNTVTLYLKPQLNERLIQTYQNRLLHRQSIAKIRYVSPEAGLAQLEKTGGWGDLLSQLPENPLPGVFELTPKPNLSEGRLKGLASDLATLSFVDKVQIDEGGMKKWAAFLALAKRSVLALGLVLGIGVFLIVGNTLRLIIEDHRQAIQVMKQVGATARYIRRPFLYVGFFYGLLGGAVRLACHHGALCLVDAGHSPLFIPHSTCPRLSPDPPDPFFSRGIAP